MSFHVGEDLGDYRIVSIIGAGSMGQVFLVEHRITKRREAAKIVSGDCLSENQIQRFQREIEVQARLDHPNIARVHNAIHWNGALVLILEFVNGESLEKKLRNGGVSRTDGIDYIRQTLSALEYAHQRGVVHRDVSPANLIVDANGKVKLTDFGVAKSPGDYQLTNAGDIVGSLYYMAPEQVHAHTDPDPRSDLYSTGAVLYEILTGKKLFSCVDKLSLMLAQVSRQPVAPNEIDPTIGPEMSEIILKALSKDRFERYQSALEFREALDSADGHLRAPRTEPRRFLARLRMAAIAVTAAMSFTGGVDRSSVPSAAFAQIGGTYAQAIVPEHPRPREVTTPSPVVASPVAARPGIARPVIARSVNATPVISTPAIVQAIPTPAIPTPAAESVQDTDLNPTATAIPEQAGPPAPRKHFWSKLNPFRKHKPGRS